MLIVLLANTKLQQIFEKPLFYWAFLRVGNFSKEEGHPAINMDRHIVGPKEVCDSLWEYRNGVCKESVSL